MPTPTAESNRAEQILSRHGESADNGSRELLEKILKDEETHIDWLEARADQIAQMGLENHLANQA